jgi:hypothetical protein
MSEIKTTSIPVAYSYTEHGLVEVQEQSNGSGIILSANGEKFTLTYEQWHALKKCVATILKPTE